MNKSSVTQLNRSITKLKPRIAADLPSAKSISSHKAGWIQFHLLNHTWTSRFLIKLWRRHSESANRRLEIWEKLYKIQERHRHIPNQLYCGFCIRFLCSVSSEYYLLQFLKPLWLCSLYGTDLWIYCFMSVFDFAIHWFTFEVFRFADYFAFVPNWFGHLSILFCFVSRYCYKHLLINISIFVYW